MAGRGRFHQNDVQTGFFQHFAVILIKGNLRQFIFQRTLIFAGQMARLVKTVRIQVAGGDRLETVDPVIGPFQHGAAAVSQSDTAQSKFAFHKKPSFLWLISRRRQSSTNCRHSDNIIAIESKSTEY